MEAIKGVIFPQGTVPLVDGSLGYKYIIAMVFITDVPLPIPEADQVIIMGATKSGNAVEQLALNVTAYKPPYNLGDLSAALSDISRQQPEDLEKFNLDGPP